MRHAGSAPNPIGPLAIAMVEPAFRALLVPLARGAETASAAFPPTREAAIDVAAIAGGTEEEGLPAQAARPHQEDRHSPAGPEGFGGQWTSARECATTGSSRSRPRGVGAPEGLEGRAPGPHPSPSGVAAAYLKIPPPSTLSGNVSGFLLFQMTANMSLPAAPHRRPSVRCHFRQFLLKATAIGDPFRPLASNWPSCTE